MALTTNNTELDVDYNNKTRCVIYVTDSPYETNYIVE